MNFGVYYGSWLFCGSLWFLVVLGFLGVVGGCLCLFVFVCGCLWLLVILGGSW